MAVVGEKMASMTDAPNPEKIKLWSQFHLLEEEKTSLQKLIDELITRLDGME